MTYRFKLCAMVMTSAVAFASPAITQDQSVFSAAYGQGFIDIDPSSANSNEIALIANVYEALVRYVPGVDGADATIEPSLATSWSVSDDQLTWTFKLREGVTFHDGTPFTSEAVKYSIERTQALDSGSAWIWWMVTSVDTPDANTAVFNLSDPAPIDLIASSAYAAWIMSPSIGEQDSAWFNAGNAVGTGPFTLQSYEPGVRAILNRNADYWGGKPTGGIDIAVLEAIEDSVLREQQLLGGQTDWAQGLETDNLAAIDAADGVRVDTAPAFQNFFGMFNTTRAPLDNADVRRALSMAFPYDDFIGNVLSDTVAQSRGIVPFGMPGYAADAVQYDYDLDAARALLASAGVDGLEITVTYTSGVPEAQKAAEVYKASLAEIGVTLNLQPMAWEAQWELAKADPANAQDIFMMSWWPTYVVAYDFLGSLYHSADEVNFNLSYYNNPDFDQMINDANAQLATDPGAAYAGFAAAGAVLAADAPGLFIYDTQAINGIRDDIKGYVANPAYSGVVFLNEITR